VLLADLEPRVRDIIATSALGTTFGPGELELTFDEALFALGPTGEMPTGAHPVTTSRE
jgi:hypothetical protein